MKKLFLFIAALSLCAGMWAIDNVAYIDATGSVQTANGVTEVTDASAQVTWNAGWYVVTGTDVKLSAGAVCAGDVRLILADGAKLTANGGSKQAGIQVSGTGNSLTIYGQTDQSGQLFATGGLHAAGIGGGNSKVGSNITINGGTVTAKGGSFSAGIGGGHNCKGTNITINGGTVTATGGPNPSTQDKSGAGIGGGSFGNGENITINGGIVTATGLNGGAGIGGGEEGRGSYITINGGTVTATGGEQAAGIGGGKRGTTTGMDGSNITISGGTVTATGGNMAAGIGGGEGGSGSNITISGGTVTANGGNDASGIGGGKESYGSSIFADIVCVVKADNTNPPTTEITNAGSDLAGMLANKQYVTVKFEPKPLYVAGYNAGYAAAKAELLGDMATPAAGQSVIVTDGTTTVKLYNPTSVTYHKEEAE